MHDPDFQSGKVAHMEFSATLFGEVERQKVAQS